MLRQGVFSFVLIAAAAAVLPAQRYESPEHGFRLQVARGLEPVPTEPNERQILAKFVGTVDFEGKHYKDEYDCTVMVVRIRKNKGPITGESTERNDDQTLREKAIEALNSGTTVEEFLAKRGYKNDLRPLDEPERKVKTKDGYELQVKQLEGQVFDENRWQYFQLPLIRSYVIENDREIFGLVSIGPFIKPFDRMVIRMASSLEQIQLGARDDGHDYGDSELANTDFRERVRAKLVKGWKAYDTENYIFVTNSRRKSLVDKMLQDLEIMRRVYMDRFPPVGKMNQISAVRYCETYDDYMAYGAPDGTAGYWNFIDEELVLVDVKTLGKDVLKRNPNLKNIDPIDVLHHEGMHQYFFYANGHLAPASWFNEGYGEYFAGAAVDRRKGEIKSIERNRFRMAWIKQAQRIKAWPDLRTFLKMTQSQFYGRSAMQNYAFAWAFCYFLEQEKTKRNPNLEWAAIPDNYLKNLREITEATRKEHGFDEKDKNWLKAYEIEIQRKAFEATFKDIDLVELEEAWIDAMKGWRR